MGAVWCDPRQLENALLNLTNNARDANPNEREIIIGTDDVLIHDDDIIDQTDARVGTYVEIFVTDTGIGMDEDTRMHVFEPFFTTKPIRRRPRSVASVWLCASIWWFCPSGKHAGTRHNGPIISPPPPTCKRCSTCIIVIRVE